jgi:hypothetical protein
LNPYWVFWAELGLIALTSGAFLVIGVLLCRRQVWARYAAVTVGAVCLGYRILTSTFPHRFYIEFPYPILSAVIAPAGFLLLAGALTLTMKKSRQRILVGVFSVVLTYYVFCDAAYLAVKGADVSRLKGHWQQVEGKGQVVHAMGQSRRFTCGPAAAATLLRAWGITVTEGDVAFAARTSFRGTELPRLAGAIRGIAWNHERWLDVEILSTTLEGLHELNRPAVLMVRKGRRRHVVTLLRQMDGRLLVADPGSGPAWLNRAEFEERYNWHGRAIAAWRDPEYPPRSGEPPDPVLHY